jgi:uncharacterized protein
MDKLPKRAGISLNAQHYQDILQHRPDVGWFEIHPEPYLGLGGAAHSYLEKITADYPLSINSRNLSMGSAESVDAHHLEDIKSLVEHYGPVHFSEYLGWNRWQGDYFYQTLPLPYNTETLDQVSFNLRTIQNHLGRRVLVENPVRLIPMADDFNEGIFFSELVRSSGCGMLLDLTNLYISCMNLGRDPFKELQAYPLAAVKEIHLSGHALQTLDQDHILLIDSAHTKICKPVWQLYKETIQLLPSPVATLIDWTEQVPNLDVLVEEAHKADQIVKDLTLFSAVGNEV